MTNPPETKEERAAIVATLGLTIESVFVPFSRSRNKGEKHPSLNWVVTVARNGKPFLLTDYMAGSGHCPSYKQPGFGKRTIADRERDERVAWECETGRKFGQFDNVNRMDQRPATIKPDALDVLASLVMDSSALDESSFEDWASSLGYDVDSRKAESIYRACLDIALKLRAALGDSGLQTLRNAFEGY